MIIEITEETIELANLLYMSTYEVLGILLSTVDDEVKLSLLSIIDGYEYNLFKKVNEYYKKYRGYKIIRAYGKRPNQKRFLLKKEDLIKENL